MAEVVLVTVAIVATVSCDSVNLPTEKPTNQHGQGVGNKEIDTVGSYNSDSYTIREIEWGYSNLREAARLGNLDGVKKLLESGADVNEVSGVTGAAGDMLDSMGVGAVSALYFAALQGDEVMAEYLLAHGADPDIPFDDGRTALHTAVISSEPEIVPTGGR